MEQKLWKRPRVHLGGFNNTVEQKSKDIHKTGGTKTHTCTGRTGKINHVDLAEWPLASGNQIERYRQYEKYFILQNN